MRRHNNSYRGACWACLIGITLGIGAAWAAPEYAKPNDEDLLELLINVALPEGPDSRVVYVSKQPLTGGSVITSWMSVLTVPEIYEQAWFFFVDDLPEANWEHPCRYIFIDSETSKYQVNKAKTPPNEIDVMRKLFPKE